MYKKQSFEIHSEKVEHNSIMYLINEEKRSAGVIGCKKNLDNIIIPRSIKQKSKEYNVTIILEDAFKYSLIKSVQFSSDSKIQIIDKNAFSNSKINSITIPPSIILIGEGAFYECLRFEKKWSKD